MARTRAAGDNRGYRDAPATTAVPRPPRAGAAPAGARRPGGGPSKHLFGVFSVVAVFALVGVTLWRPLAALVALPVIIVLALAVRTAIPVPPPARTGAGAAGTRARPARSAPARPDREAPGRDARPVAGRAGDRPPYDQEIDRPPRRRAGASAAPPPPAGQYRPGPRYQSEDATEVYRTDEPDPRGRRRPAARPEDARRDGRRPADGWPGAGERDAGRAPAGPRRADRSGGDAFAPPPYDRPGAADRPETDPRRRPAAASQDHRDTPGYPADPAARGVGRGDRYADDPYSAAPRPERPGGRFAGPADGFAGPADGRGWAPGDGYPGDHRGPAGDQYPDGYDRAGYGREGYDDYPDHELAGDEPGRDAEPGRDQAGAAGNRRRRGWRHQVWDDDEGWEETPEPEPDEDMMHTMSIDMRGYLDDTGSFRMP